VNARSRHDARRGKTTVTRAPQAVADHYKRRALGDVVLAALQAAGKDIEHLTPDDLAPIDEFHSGGRNATIRLAQLAEINGSERVLDVGCGIGGPRATSRASSAAKSPASISPQNSSPSPQCWRNAPGSRTR
jgi:cyclopropane fatty-acyl-phospholipid synthase-like methyltransferase